jgi:hypothetical protein
MDPTDDKKIEILYAHYSDTFAVIQSHIRQRDRYFLGILAVIAIMSFQIALPTESGDVMADLFRRHIGVESVPSISFLSSIIWATLMFVVVRYYQTNVGLERQYRYIHALEETLQAHYSGVAFSREGKHYLTDYPLFSAATSRLYTLVFPVSLVLVSILKIVSELRIQEASTIPLAINGLLCLLTIAASALYLLHVNFGA